MEELFPSFADAGLPDEDELNDIVCSDFLQFLREEAIGQEPFAQQQWAPSLGSDCSQAGPASRSSPEVTSSFSTALNSAGSGTLGGNVACAGPISAGPTAAVAGAEAVPKWQQAVVTTAAPLTAAMPLMLVPMTAGPSPTSSSSGGAATMVHLGPIVPGSAAAAAAEFRSSAEPSTTLTGTSSDGEGAPMRAGGRRGAAAAAAKQRAPSQKQLEAAAKRKAPEVDWRAIGDVSERRKQRRLAKNRVTAARSRERKKEAWGELEARMEAMEEENARMRALLEGLAAENTNLKDQLRLASLYRGAGQGAPGGAAQGYGSGGGGTGTTEPAVLACVAILHSVWCLLLLLLLPSLCCAPAPAWFLGSDVSTAVSVRQGRQLQRGSDSFHGRHDRSNIVDGHTLRARHKHERILGWGGTALAAFAQSPAVAGTVHQPHCHTRPLEGASSLHFAAAAA